jgi:K(+)-stimulated pyrophosphate-energized sodium pump
MSANALIPIIFGLGGLGVAWFIFQKVKEYPEGEPKVVAIAEQIHLGAMVFMRREYKLLAWFCLVMIVILWYLLGIDTVFAFLVGALSSAGAGYIGMTTATRANVRTATAAHERGAAEALTIAFFGGSIMGLAVAALGLFGLGLLYLFFGGDPHTAHRRCSPAWAVASSPRARTWARTSSASWKPGFPRTTREIPASLPTTSATTSATWPAWVPTSSSRTAVP